MSSKWETDLLWKRIEELQEKVDTQGHAVTALLSQVRELQVQAQATIDKLKELVLHPGSS